MNREESALEKMRKEYSKRQLEIDEVHPHPFTQFQQWFDQVKADDQFEANAMTLATADAAGRPSARIVLLKGITEKGYVWYTNYESKKGQDLLTNPYAALVFHWAPLEQQIRIEGKVRRISPEASDAYFNVRPKGSRIGAIASPQSSVIENRQVLEDKVKELNTQFAETEQIPRPTNWGGYELIPDRFEFWQGRPSRLHDRIVYQKSETGWSIERVAP